MTLKKNKKTTPAGQPAGISLPEKFSILYVYIKTPGKPDIQKERKQKNGQKLQTK